MSDEGAVNARAYLEEGKKYILQRNPVQASEKLYKAAEEAVKRLAERFGIPEREEAKGKGRWTASLLFSGVRRLSEMVDARVLDWWDHAWFLHVEGFHEARLRIEEVEARAAFVEELVRLSESEA